MGATWVGEEETGHIPIQVFFERNRFEKVIIIYNKIWEQNRLKKRVKRVER